MATLEGRRVLVTGAAGAIGAALSAALREQGALVIGLDRTPAEDEGVLECDVRDPEQVRVAVAEALERLGGLDVLVNNAGIGDAHDAGAEPDERALAILEVNYLAHGASRPRPCPPSWSPAGAWSTWPPAWPIWPCLSARRTA